MKKRILSMLLAIVMVASLLPTMSLAASAEQTNPVEHIHDNLFTYSHYYTELTANTTSITEESFFYLTDDIELDGTLTVSSGWSYLCLNGHTLSLKSGVTGSVIKVESGAVLSICNCSGDNGVITGGNAINGGGICNEGVVRIERNNTGKIVVTGNTASSLGGGIYNGNSMLVASPFEVTGNTAGGNGGGLYFHYIPEANFFSCQITGDTWIINNSVSGKANNVCLEKGAYFSCDDKSEVTAQIGITPAEAPTALEPLDVLTDSSECPQGACAWEGVFFADDPTLYSIKLEPYNSGGTEGRYKLYLERTPGVGDVLYPIQFDSNASGIPDPVSAPYLAGSTLPLKDTKISKPGAIFLGWKCSTDDKVYTGSYTIPADFNDPNGITFTALWGYDVSYHVNKGIDSAKYAMTEKSAYQAGETVVVSPREGYVLNTVYYKNSNESTFTETATPQSDGTHTFTMPANDVVIWVYSSNPVPTGTHTHDCNHTYCDGTWENASFLSDSSQLRPSVTSGSTSYFMLRRNFDPGFDPSTFEPTLSSGTATIYLCLNGYKINTVTVPSGVTMYICNCAAANGSVPNLNNNGTVYVGAGTYKTIGPAAGEIHVYDEITLTDYKYTSSRIFRMMSTDARIHFSGKPDGITPIKVYPYAEGVFATGWDDSYGRLSNIVKSGDSQYTVESDGGNLIARKKPTFAVTYADPNGVTANGKYQVDKTEAVFEERVNITITPDSGYEVDSVTVVRTANNGTVIVYGTGNTRYFWMPGADATVRVTFKPGPILVTGVSLDETNIALTVGDTKTLTATVTPDNATNKTVNWTSGNTSVATVDSSGKVTAVAAGTATITATAADGSGVSAACTVTVNAVTYTITKADTENGTVTVDKTTAADGETVTITITPDNGYEVETVSYTPAGGSTTAVAAVEGVYSFRMPAANVTVTVTFREIVYTGTVSEEDGAMENVTVNGLGEVAEEINKNIVLTVKVEAADANDTEQTAIKGQAGNRRLDFLDITLEDDGGNSVDVPQSIVLEISIPFTVGNKKNIVVYRYHDGSAAAFSALEAKPAVDARADGSFYVDKENNKIYIYTNQFSAYAIGYTVSSASGSSHYPTTYSIIVKDAANGDVYSSPVAASEGAVVSVLVYPDDDYILNTLTVTDQKGTAIELTKVSSTKYTFKMPKSGVSVEASFVKSNTVQNVFEDITADAYYYDAVLWAVEKDITKGSSTTTFSPDNPCTRAQMVAFLWRAAGSPEPTATTCPFTDVDMDSYYGKAVLWAVEKGITKGTSTTTFSPDVTCTRAQMATFLCRMAGGKAESSINAFVDVKADAYYAESVQWAVENGITMGTGDNKFSPDATCTRAQMVTFLYRYYVK